MDRLVFRAGADEGVHDVAEHLLLLRDLGHLGVAEAAAAEARGRVAHEAVAVGLGHAVGHPPLEVVEAPRHRLDEVVADVVLVRVPVDVLLEELHLVVVFLLHALEAVGDRLALERAALEHADRGRLLAVRADDLADALAPEPPRLDEVGHLGEHGRVPQRPLRRQALADLCPGNPGVFRVFPTLEASISVEFQSIRLLLGPLIISARVLEIWTQTSLASTRTKSC